MEFVYIALPLALLIAIFALVAFIWAARSGQFDDLETPGRRLLLDDEPAAQRPGHEGERDGSPRGEATEGEPDDGAGSRT